MATKEIAEIPRSPNHSEIWKGKVNESPEFPSNSLFTNAFNLQNCEEITN